uniref:Uncharacterized protein n=1 Tax=Triticum urartu TaxID=4572 RepID=A0A8R7RAX2_TRIUA
MEAVWCYGASVREPTKLPSALHIQLCRPGHPSEAVESFVERQRKAGCELRSCDTVSSPHVDHYRSNPGLYTSQPA